MFNVVNACVDCTGCSRKSHVLAWVFKGVLSCTKSFLVFDDVVLEASVSGECRKLERGVQRGQLNRRGKH